MKKIIALAVAGAFVAPVAFAADVTLSGSAEISYVDEGRLTEADNTIIANESSFTLTAADELPGGITFRVDYNLDDNSADGGSHSMTFGGPFGTVDFGDTSGAIDAVDGVTNVMRIHDNTSPFADIDAGFRWVLPTIAEGLSIHLAYSPNNGDAASVSGFDVDQQYTNSGFDDGVQGVAIRYSLPLGVTFSYASEDVGNDATTDVNNTMYNMRFAAAGFAIAYEKSEQEVAGQTENQQEATSMSVTYAMNDVTFKYAQLEDQELANGNLANAADMTVVGIDYAFGPVTFFAESGKDDVDDDSYTAVGAAYSF